MKRISRLVPLSAIAVAVATAIACTNPEEAKRQHFQRGEALMAQSKYPEAVLEYRNAIKIDPKYGDARFQLAEAQFRNGNAQQGAKELIRAADLLPERAEIQTKAAALLLASRDFDGAKKYAAAAIKAAPKNVDAQILLANAMAGLKDMAGAIREIEQTMQLAPDDSRPYTTLGSMKAAEGKRDEAEAAFRKAVAIDPHSTSAKLALAYYLWMTKHPAEAEQALRETLSADRDNPLGNRMLAVFYLTQGRTSDAETPLLRMVNAKDTSATLTLADLYARTGRIGQARPLYETLKQQKSTKALAVSRLASLDYSANKAEDAHRAVDAALKEDPKNPELLTLKARFLLAERKTNDALENARKAVAASPQSPSAHFILGSVYLARGDYDDAAKSLNESLRFNPRMIAAQISLSRLELGRGNAEQSLAYALAAQKLDPKNPEVRLAIAKAQFGKRDLPSAEAELKILQTDYPRAAAVHSLAGQVLLAKRDSAGAAREFDKALDVNPADLDALNGRLAADVQLKRPDEARARMQRALAHDARNANLLLVAARLDNTLGDPQAAERHLRNAIEIDAGNLQAFKLLASMYLRQKRLDEARQELESIVQRRPDAVGERTMIGIILDVQNRHDESRKIYESIVSGTSRAPVAANNLAYIYANRGEQLDSALQLAQSAKQQMPDSPDVNDTLGWVYFKKDMMSLAIPAFEASVKQRPDNAEYQFHLGLAYAKAGQDRKARLALEAALRLQPNFDGADLARTTLASLRG